MKKFQGFIVAGVIALFGVAAFVPTTPVSAGAIDAICNDTDVNSTVCNNSTQSTGDIVGVVINTLLFIVGAVSVIMIIVGGIRYTISGGNTSSITAAKNTILYAVIGLVVAIIAFAIVNWVIGII